MPSDLQLEANRRNAQRSTGPRTLEGKRRSAGNSLKHGLTAQHLILDPESESEFNEHAAALRDDLNAQTPAEAFFVDQIVSATWRLQRLRIVENNFYQRSIRHLGKNSAKDEDPNDLLSLSFTRNTSLVESMARHEARLERSISRAMRELERLQSRPPLPPASTPQQNLQNEPNSDPEIIDNKDVPPIPQPVSIDPKEPHARLHGGGLA